MFSLRLAWLILPLLVAPAARAQAAEGPSSTPVPASEVPVASVQDPVAAASLLEQYVALALQRSPELSALRARQASAQEAVEPAGALPDPMVGVMYQALGTPWQPMGPMSMVQGEITQPIPGGGKREARRVAARANVELQQQGVQASRARLSAEVRAVFTQLYALDREHDALTQGDALLVALLGGVTGRFVSGGIDQESLARAEFERSRLKERLLDLRSEREVLTARLNRLLARPEDSPIPQLGVLPEVPLELTVVSDATLARSPELRLRRAAVAASVASEQSAQADLSPNYQVGLAGGATTTGVPVFTFRFAMELPVWSSTKQEPMVRAARRASEAAQDEYHDEALRLRGRLAELAAEFRRAQAQIALYHDELLPRAELTLSAARNAYSVGRGDFSTIIEDYRAWLEVQSDLAQRYAERLRVWSEYRALLEDPR